MLNVFSPAKKVSIDLKEYTEPGTYIVPVSVELPDGCSLVNDVSVEIVLEKRKQSSKTQDDVYDNSQKQSSDQNQTNDSDQNTSDATTDKKQGE